MTKDNVLMVILLIGGIYFGFASRDLHFDL